ncbi:MAG TPA: hypothetical protein V6D33_08895, partial [Cyanophyceae cyanobacterium]
MCIIYILERDRKVFDGLVNSYNSCYGELEFSSGHCAHLKCGKGADAITEGDTSSRKASTPDGLASGELPPVNKLSDSESIDS